VSSHHNGPKASAGAKGKAKALEVLERPGDQVEEKVEMTDSEIVEMLTQDGVSRMRKLMRPHTDIAVATLAEVCEDKEASPSARVSASKAILDYGYGKPVSIVPASVGGGGIAGLRINLIQFFPDAVATSQAVPLDVAVEEMVDAPE